MAKCAVCERSFGLSLWKHTCVLCRRTVCGQCSSSSVPVSESAVEAALAKEKEKNGKASSSSSDGDSQGGKKSHEGKKKHKKSMSIKTPGVIEARVCKDCQESGKASGGRRLGDGTATSGVDASNAMPSSAAVASESSQGKITSGQGTRPDPNSESEREKRARLVEARMNAKKGPSSSAAATARPAPPARAAAAAVKPDQPVVPPSAPAPTATLPTSLTDSHASPSTSASVPAQPSGGNPVLEAALRRQQQRRQELPSGPEKNYSEEKRQLLREIDAIHAKTRTEEPFGLRAADESRLRSYRQHLRTTYNM